MKLVFIIESPSLIILSVEAYIGVTHFATMLLKLRWTLLCEVNYTHVGAQTPGPIADNVRLDDVLLYVTQLQIETNIVYNIIMGNL